jgi:hypothetical protein
VKIQTDYSDSQPSSLDWFYPDPDYLVGFDIWTDEQAVDLVRADGAVGWFAYKRDENPRTHLGRC